MTVTLADVLAPTSDQLAGDDLISGPRRITFTDVRLAKDGRATKMILNYEGDNGKPFKPCKTMARAMVLAWAIGEGCERDIIGKSVVVYRDPTVTFGKEGEVGGVRISHMSHIAKPVTAKLTVSQGKKSMFTFQPLTAEVRQMPTAADPAQKWAAAYIANIEAFETPEDLDAFADTKAAKIAEMETKRPELFKECTAALARRRDELDDPFAGPSDNDRGESHTTLDAEADILKHLANKMRETDVNNLIDSRIGELDEEAADRVRIAQMDRIAGIKGAKS